MKTKIILLLLGMLGFAGCSEKNIPRAEYGTPYSTFTIKGKVTDAKQNPISNIKITHSDYDEGIYTAADGTYKLSGENHWALQLTLTDIDGPENGGEFATKQLEVELTKDDKVNDGDGHWNAGDYAKTIDITLEPKE